MPGKSGTFGRARKPTLVITALACTTTGPSGPSADSSQRSAVSSQTIELTSVSNRMCSRTPNSSVTQLKYFSFSLCSQNGFG